MANSNNFSKTNAQQVRKQNQQSAAGQGQFGTEFASETNAQQVRKQTTKQLITETEKSTSSSGGSAFFLFVKRQNL